MNNQAYEQKKRECLEEFCKLYDCETPHDYIAETFDYAFSAGYALGQEKEAEKSKRMCLRDRTKVCNMCHECDIDTDAWHSMYSR